MCVKQTAGNTHISHVVLPSNNAFSLFFVWPLFHEMSMTRPVLLNTGGMNLSGQPFDGPAGCIVEDGLRLPPGR